MKTVFIIIVLALTINSVFATVAPKLSNYAGKNSVEIYNAENGTNY